MTQKNATFVILPCSSCGHVQKIDVSKYKPSVRRGLLREYTAQPKPVKDSAWSPHSCPVCGGNCKAPNGHGTQKAAELDEIDERRRKIILAIRALGRGTVRQIDAYLLDKFQIATTDIATHSRISDLVTWGLVRQVSLDGPTQPADIYPDTKAAAYTLNEERVRILETYNWQTWILRAIDNDASWSMESFT